MRSLAIAFFAALPLVWAQAPAAPAKKMDPIQWSAAAAAPAADGKFVVTLKATSEAGWHLYSMTTPRPPIATSAKVEGVETVDVFQPAPIRKLDKNFEAETETFEGETVFYVQGQLPAGTKLTTVNVRYQACDDRQCLPPRKKSIAIAPGAAAVIPANYAKVAALASAPPSSAAPKPAAPQPGTDDLGQFLLIAFGFGLAALFTPCVFPMIPITMSFFLGQSEGRSRGQQIVQALIFCLGIVFLFTLLGFSLTAIMGPFGVVQIASNPWVNSVIAGVFIALAFSLFGAYEITLPSGLLTKLNAASNGGGTIGTLLMGLTFSLTSFACVGPFVGTLLAASVSGNKLQPVLGMMAFSSGLALPFFFLAIFPSFLAKLPRSGMWMVRIKIVFGFVILAAALKYLGNVDQVLQWNFLTRERFIAAWFVLFTLPGLYLLGMVPMEGIKRDEPVGVGRLLTGVLFVIFAFSLLPGMLGAKLGELDAFVPLAQEQAGGGAASSSSLPWMKNDLKGALAKAKAEGKQVFVNFTGYACTNCHWMKANMFPRPEIREALSKYVLLELYTDGTDAASEENQKYQEAHFQTVAIPLYAIIDADEKQLAVFPGITKSPQEYLAFLTQRAPAQLASR